MNGTATPEQLGQFIAAHLDYGRLAAEIVVRLEDTPPTSPELVPARDIARRIGRSPRWVRDHKGELGGVAMSNGPRPRWGFDPAHVARVSLLEALMQHRDVRRWSRMAVAASGGCSLWA